MTVIRVNVLPELYHRLFDTAIVKAFDLKEVSTLSDSTNRFTDRPYRSGMARNQNPVLANQKPIRLDSSACSFPE